MADGRDINNMGAVINAVEHPVISDANAPEKIITLKFLATGWPWIGCERVNFRKDSLDRLGRELFQLLAR